MSTPTPCSPATKSKRQKLGKVLRYHLATRQADVALVKSLEVGQCIEVVRPPSKWHQTVGDLWVGGKQVPAGEPGQTVRFEVLNPVLQEDAIFGFVAGEAGTGAGGGDGLGSGNGASSGVGSVGHAGGGGRDSGGKARRKRRRGGG